MIFSRMNKSIPFFSEDELKSSILYEPVKTIAPLIFPNIIKTEDDSESDEVNS